MCCFTSIPEDSFGAQQAKEAHLASSYVNMMEVLRIGMRRRCTAGALARIS